MCPCASLVLDSGHPSPLASVSPVCESKVCYSENLVFGLVLCTTIGSISEFQFRKQETTSPFQHCLEIWWEAVCQRLCVDA